MNLEKSFSYLDHISFEGPSNFFSCPDQETGYFRREEDLEGPEESFSASASSRSDNKEVQLERRSRFRSFFVRSFEAIIPSNGFDYSNRLNGCD